MIPSADDLADAVVAGVGDEQIARSIHGDTLRIVEVGGGSRAAVSAETAVVAPVNSVATPATVVMITVRGDLADAGVAAVGDEQVAGSVHRDTLRIVELGGSGGAAVAAEAGTSPCPPPW